VSRAQVTTYNGGKLMPFWRSSSRRLNRSNGLTKDGSGGSSYQLILIIEVSIETSVGESHPAHEFSDSDPLQSPSTELFRRRFYQAFMSLRFMLC
jgi:hypothetical protein